jgi:RNA polymerase sigma factor (TIGR02999 family)
LLQAATRGDRQALERFLAQAYAELRGLAQGLMHRERRDHTLQPTALVHEAAARLLGSKRLADGRDQSYLFGAMAEAMRRVLIDHARARRADRRGGQRARVPLDDVVDDLERTFHVDILAVEQFLEELQTLNPRQARLVALRFYGGLELRAIAEHLEVSLSTVEKEWRLTRAWLRVKLKQGQADGC